jgi:hypothetical protein
MNKYGKIKNKKEKNKKRRNKLKGTNATKKHRPTRDN